jgi:hypothetical protein
MKTTSFAAHSYEVVKRAVYAFEVLVIGLFIPFLFVIGINTSIGDNPANHSTIEKHHVENASGTTATNTVNLAYQHS